MNKIKRIFSKQTIVPLGLYILVATTIAPADAHHGWSFYNGEALEIKGVLVETHFRNPHDYIKVIADGKSWLAYFGPPARNRRAGLTEESIKVGEEVTVFGHQHNDPSKLEMKTERIMIGDTILNFYPERE